MINKQRFEQKNNKKIRRLFLVNIGYLLLRHLTSSNNFWITTPSSVPIIPALFRLVPEIISYVLMIFCLFQKGRKVLKSVGLFLFFFLFSNTISSVISLSGSNSIDFVRFISSIRSLLIWLAPFLIGLTLFKIDDIKYFWIVSVMISIAQVPFVFIQSGMAPTADYVTGLMGEWGSGYLAIFQTLNSLYLLDYILKGKVHLIVGIILVGVIIIPVILANAVVIFVLVPLSWLIYFIFSHKNPKKFLYFIILLFFLLSSLFIMVYIFSQGRSNSLSGSVEFLSEKFSRALENSPVSYSGPTRTYFLLKSIEYVLKTPISSLFGYGLGSASSSRLSPFNINENILQGSTGVGSLFIYTLIESGIFGTISILIFLMTIYRNNYQKNTKNKKIYKYEFSDIALTTTIIIGILIFYNRSFASPSFAWILMPQLGIYCQKGEMI